MASIVNGIVTHDDKIVATMFLHHSCTKGEVEKMVAWLPGRNNEWNMKQNKGLPVIV